MASRTRKPRFGSLLVGAVIVAAAFVAVAVAITIITDEAATFWESATKAALTVAAGAIITGGIGVVVQKARDREEADREERAFIEGQVVQLWELHDQVKTAAVLIAAHQTAKTYGEQMRALIGTRTRLSDVEGVIERRLGRDPTIIDSGAFSSCVATATAFLHPLVDEYRHRYLSGSYRQRVDEQNNTKLDKKGVYKSNRRSTLAWDMLSDPSKFPYLADLISFGNLTSEDLEDPRSSWACENLQLEYLDPLRDAIWILRGRAPDSGGPRVTSGSTT